MSLRSDMSLISEAGEELARSKGFKLRSPFCERYGSWEMVFHMEAAPGVDRFLTVGISDSSEEAGRSLIELYVFAQSERHRSKKLHTALRYESGESQETLRSTVFQNSLSHAFDAAAALVPTELRQDYLFSLPPTSANAASSSH